MHSGVTIASNGDNVVTAWIDTWTYDIYTVSSEDNGDTWKKVVEGLPIGKNMGRIGIAVSHSNSKKVYVLIDNLSKERSNAAEVYTSENGGENWRRKELVFTSIDDLLFKIPVRSVEITEFCRKDQFRI